MVHFKDRSKDMVHAEENACSPVKVMESLVIGTGTPTD
jgi:hypothetical protein